MALSDGHRFVVVVEKTTYQAQQEWTPVLYCILHENVQADYGERISGQLFYSQLFQVPDNYLYLKVPN